MSDSAWMDIDPNLEEKDIVWVCANVTPDGRTEILAYAKTKGDAEDWHKQNYNVKEIDWREDSHIFRQFNASVAFYDWRRERVVRKIRVDRVELWNRQY